MIPPLGGISVTPELKLTLDLGTVIVGGVGALMTWTATKIWRELRTLLHRFERHEDVMDAHTDVLVRLGWPAPESVYFHRNRFRTRATDFDTPAHKPTS